MCSSQVVCDTVVYGPIIRALVVWIPGQSRLCGGILPALRSLAPVSSLDRSGNNKVSAILDS